MWQTDIVLAPVLYLISIAAEFPDSCKTNAECFLVLCCIDNTKSFQRIQICVADYSNRGHCSEQYTRKEVSFVTQ